MKKVLKNFKMETLNQLYDRLGLHKWWQDKITNPNAVYNNLPLLSKPLNTSSDYKFNNGDR